MNQPIINALREFLWMALCWNDHNFREGVVTKKCREVCEGLGIESAAEGNALLDSLQSERVLLEKEREQACQRVNRLIKLGQYTRHHANCDKTKAVHSGPSGLRYTGACTCGLEEVRQSLFGPTFT